MKRPVRFLLAAAAAAWLLGCGPSPRPPEPPPEPQSLYERLGQLPLLRRWVDELVWRLAADEQLGSAYVDVDLAALKRQMLQMTCAVTDGPCRYDLARLARANRGRRPSGAELDRFLDIAARAARSVEMPEAPAAELVDRLRRLGPRLGGSR